MLSGKTLLKATNVLSGETLHSKRNDGGKLKLTKFMSVYNYVKFKMRFKFSIPLKVFINQALTLENNLKLSSGWVVR